MHHHWGAGIASDYQQLHLPHTLQAQPTPVSRVTLGGSCAFCCVVTEEKGQSEVQRKKAVRHRGGYNGGTVRRRSLRKGVHLLTAGPSALPTALRLFTSSSLASDAMISYMDVASV